MTKYAKIDYSGCVQNQLWGIDESHRISIKHRSKKSVSSDAGRDPAILFPA